jgi:hypothetical protein
MFCGLRETPACTGISGEAVDASPSQQDNTSESESAQAHTTASFEFDNDAKR